MQEDEIRWKFSNRIRESDTKFLCANYEGRMHSVRPMSKEKTILK